MSRNHLSMTVRFRSLFVGPGRSTAAALLVASLMLSGALVAPRAQAQDMDFSIDETGQPPAPPAEGPPSEALANALRLYQSENYPAAAVQFQRVVEGESQDAPANVQKAQFFLGKCLYHLHYYQSALALFEESFYHGIRAAEELLGARGATVESML